MSRQRPRKVNNNMTVNTSSQHFELRKIKPITDNQAKAFNDYAKGQNLVLHGYAGTGKTFIALSLALKDVIQGTNGYDKVIIIRSVVASRDIGFLPGSIKEKIKIFEEPYEQICDELFSTGNGYNVLKTKNLVEFTTTSYLRGLTFNNAIIIVDEVNNMSWPEINTVMTRVGDNSKIIFCGDYRQSDLKNDSEKEGLKKFINIIKKIPSFSLTEFEIDDIVRSGLVREWIIAEAEYEQEKL